MKPTIDTANTLILGCYTADGHCAVTGTMLDGQYETVPDVLTATGATWAALAEALTIGAAIDVGHVLILSNDEALVKALSPPFKARRDGEPVTVYVPPLLAGRKVAAEAYTVTAYEPDPAHWHALTMLGMRWGGNFRAMHVEDLPRTRSLWQSQR